MTIPQDQDLCWSLDFVMDTLVSGGRFCILTWSRTSLGRCWTAAMSPLSRALGGLLGGRRARPGLPRRPQDRHGGPGQPGARPGRRDPSRTCRSARTAAGSATSSSCRTPPRATGATSTSVTCRAASCSRSTRRRGVRSPTASPSPRSQRRRPVRGVRLAGLAADAGRHQRHPQRLRPRPADGDLRRIDAADPAAYDRLPRSPPTAGTSPSSRSTRVTRPHDAGVRARSADRRHRARERRQRPGRQDESECPSGDRRARPHGRLQLYRHRPGARRHLRHQHVTSVT